MKEYFWLYFRECSHGEPWPCKQPEGYLSCGDNGWTIGTYDGKEWYQIIGSDNIYRANEFSKIVPLKARHPSVGR